VNLAPDEVIETLTPDRSDQPFGKAILPRRSRRYRLVPDPHSTNSALGDVAIEVIGIADEVVWRLIPGECLGELTCNPICGRVLCHVNPDQLYPWLDGPNRLTMYLATVDCATEKPSLSNSP